MIQTSHILYMSSKQYTTIYNNNVTMVCEPHRGVVQAMAYVAAQKYMNFFEQAYGKETAQALTAYATQKKEQPITTQIYDTGKDYRAHTYKSGDALIKALQGSYEKLPAPKTLNPKKADLARLINKELSTLREVQHV
jgi:hypothetical protein